MTLVARGADRLALTMAQFAAQGLVARALPLDITDIDATEAAVAANGPFDILVNSAGLARHAPALDDQRRGL